MLSRNICFIPSTQNLITFHKGHHHVMRPSPCPSKTNHFAVPYHMLPHDTDLEFHITCCHNIRTLNSISHHATRYVPWIPYHMLPQDTYLEFHITCCHKTRTFNSISHAATRYVSWIPYHMLPQGTYLELVFISTIFVFVSLKRSLHIYTTSTETKIPKNINKGRNRQGEIYG